MAFTELITPEMISELGSLEIKARRIVDGLHIGRHRGKRLGFSSDFAEHRDYSAGDDVRHIDWKIFAKRDRYYVRRFEDEVKLQAWMIVDFSSSMTYQSKEVPLSKLAYANCLAASLAWLLVQQQDRVGLLTFTDKLEEVISPRSDLLHLQQIFLHLQRLQDRSLKSQDFSKTPWSVLGEAIGRIADRSIVFLLTDAFGDLEQFLKILQQLQHKHCDVRLLHVIDPAERLFPFSESTRFKNLEGGHEISVSANSIREAYVAEFDHFLDSIRRHALELGTHYELVETNAPFTRVLERIVR